MMNADTDIQKLAGIYMHQYYDNTGYVDVLSYCLEYFQYYRQASRVSANADLIKSRIRIMTGDPYFQDLSEACKRFKHPKFHTPIERTYLKLRELFFSIVPHARHHARSDKRAIEKYYHNVKLPVPKTTGIQYAVHKNKKGFEYDQDIDLKPFAVEIIHNPHLLFKDEVGKYDWDRIEAFLRKRLEQYRKLSIIGIVFMPIRDTANTAGFYQRFTKLLNAITDDSKKSRIS